MGRRSIKKASWGGLSGDGKLMIRNVWGWVGGGGAWGGLWVLGGSINSKTLDPLWVDEEAIRWPTGIRCN